jgi:hypothetical protein
LIEIPSEAVVRPPLNYLVHHSATISGAVGNLASTEKVRRSISSSRSCFGRLRISRPFPKIRLHGGNQVCYRLDKGDLHSIRDVWFDEAYRLPFDDPSGTLLDPGTNIGVTSV